MRTERPPRDDTAQPTDDSEAPAVDELLAAIQERLRAATGTKVPTTAVGRFGRTAALALRGGVAALGARWHGSATPKSGTGLGLLDARALEAMVSSLGELKGIAMKVGQILSYIDESLPPEQRQILALLQTQSQPTAWAVIAETIAAAFGTRAQALLAGLEPTPVASASIGQVHRGRLPDGAAVAVKVRHPDIEAAIRADFRAAGLGKVFARMFAPGANVAAFIQEAEARFLEECNYRLEAERQARFARLYAAHPVLRVPAVYPEWSGDTVLTTAWYDGMGFEAFLASEPSLDTRNRLARALYAFYVGTLYRHGWFNADPHPGNLLFSEDRVAVLDYGCVRAFAPAQVAALAALSRAVRQDDAAAIAAALAALGVPEPACQGERFAVTRGLLRGFYGPLLGSGARRIEAAVSFEARRMIANKRAVMRMQLPGELLFLFRIRFGLYAVLGRLGAELDWGALEDEAMG